MKKIVFAMAALLSTSAAFVSCSNNDVFEEGAAEQAKVAQIENQYKQEFVKHFGEVAANQSWDFSQSNTILEDEAVAQTRAQEKLPVPTFAPSGNIWDRIVNTVLGNNFYAHAITDFDEVKTLVDEMPEVEWPFEYAQVNIHPFYTRGTSVLNYYFLGVKYNKTKTDWLGRTKTVPAHNAFCFKSLGAGWHSIVGFSNLQTNWNMNSYVIANTTNMEGANGFKWFVASRNTEFFDTNSNVDALKKCKVFTVNGHTYVALDCNEDGTYGDLVCWVEDLSPAKRYMVEDLGSIGDFDFNDIVFDVVRNENTGKYECIVRAMGGTLDFTITVGETPWTKSEHYNIKQMINTTDPEYNLENEYARFEVKGWHPEQNNVSVTVVGKDGVLVLPFPEDGSIPYMVCTNIAKPWSKEQVDVKTIGWFGSVVNGGEIEVKDAE